MKAAATIGAVATLGALAVYKSNEGSQLFLSEVITPEEFAYMKYVTEFGKSYGTKAEFMFRMEQFKKTMKKMEEHNSDNAASSTVGLNQFSDWTESEYKKLLGYKPVARNGPEPPLLSTENLADSVDWRTKGAVTPVKNQGQCGSCWAFSTTGSVEGAMFLKNGNLQSFSESQLVDCSTQNQGCNGGLMDWAFQYIESNPLMLEADYPYVAMKKTCKYVKSKGVGKVVNFQDVRSDTSGAQLRAAINKQPVSIAVEADQMAFQGYTGGVVTSGCGKNLDHGVLAVGYGTENGQDYFLVKNSWGASWGDEGYLKIAPNQCGITKQPSFPTE